MTSAGKAAIGILAAAILIILIAFHLPTGVSSSATTPRPVSASPAPTVVVREFFAAINRHRWREVWQLGGRNLGYGPYASYRGMISGYRLTARDVLLALNARGDSVSGRFLAYETTGAIQHYRFRYIVRGGTIVTGHLTLISS
jgi:hypothetical protein